jgi:hypothetical protein
LLRKEKKELFMKVAQPFVHSAMEEIKAALDGGTLVLYSVARPKDPDHKVERSGVLATFTFGSPAFGSNGNPEPVLVANPVLATGTGTPGFARLYTAAGAAVADLAVGPGQTEVKLTEVSTTPNFPVTLTQLSLT